MSVEQEFKAGTVVQLKSGGPKMTIDGFKWDGGMRSTEEVECLWFDDTELKQGTFHISSLKQELSD